MLDSGLYEPVTDLERATLSMPLGAAEAAAGAVPLVPMMVGFSADMVAKLLEERWKKGRKKGTKEGVIDLSSISELRGSRRRCC